MTVVHIIVWLDNFNELKYTCNPLRRNVSHDSTAFAMLNVIPWTPFDGYISLQELVNNAFPVIDDLVNTSLSVPALLAAVKLLDRDSLRSPLDVTRVDVVSLRWRPLAVAPWVSGSNMGLLHILEYCKQLRTLVAPLDLPLMMDANIHQRLLKLVYGYGHLNYWANL